MEAHTAIVIPAHGQAGLTRACLGALARQELGDVEVVLVEDGPAGGAAAIPEALARRVQRVRRESQGGFSSACNEGARASRADHIVFLNNDTLPADGWLAALLAYSESRPRAAVVGAKLLWPDNTVQHAGIVFGCDRNAYHLYEGFPHDHPAVNVSRELQAVTAAAVLVRRDAFDTVGGFDEGFVNGWEDVDLCLRIREVGWQVHYCHDAVVLHLESATRGRRFDGDEHNYVRFSERWAQRVTPDELAVYAEDGLVEARREQGGLRFGISPVLGQADAGDGVARLLAQRTAHGLELLRDNVRLATATEPPADAWHGIRRRQASVFSVTVVMPVGEHGLMGEMLSRLDREKRSTKGAYEVIVAAPQDRLDEAMPGPVDDDPEFVGRVYSDPAGGRAAALNRGIEAASGEIVLLLVDDFLPAPGTVATHLAVHEADPRPHVATLGPAFCPPAMRSSFVSWLEDSGELFGVPFTAGAVPPPRFWYCANTSLKRSFLLEGRLFDERLALEAWDDHELGLRLFDRGMEVRYVPEAAARHEHPVTFEERSAVMGDAGRSAAVFDEIYPPPHPWATGFDPAESPLELGAKALLGRLAHRFTGDSARLHASYSAAMRRAFVEGYRSRAVWDRG